MNILLALSLLLAQYSHRSNPGTPGATPSAITSAGASNCPGSGCVCVDSSGGDTVVVKISGTWTATNNFYGVNNADLVNGLTALPLYPYNTTTGALSAAVVSTTANGTWQGSTGGFRQICVYASAFTSNTSMAVSIDVDPGSSFETVQGVPGGVAIPTSNNSSGATGSAVPASADFIAGGAAAGAGNLTGATVKAASTLPAATDTALVTTNRDLVANDTTAVASGIETQPGVAKASRTAVTAGRSEKIQQRAADGSVFTTDDASAATGAAVPAAAGFVGGGAAGGAGNLTGTTVKAASTIAAATDTAMVVTPRETLANDTTAIGNGATVFPGVARAAPTATTAGRSEAIEQSTTNGGVFANLVGGAGVLVVDANAKGTQGTNFLATQEPHNTGRTFVTLNADGITAVVSNTIFTVAKNVNGTVTGSQTTYTITSGKTFRVQAISFSATDTSTVANRVVGYFRLNNGGACIATSGVVASCEMSSSTGTVAANEGNMQCTIPIPDGLEITGDGTKAICMSESSTATSATITANLIGYEY